MDVWALFVSGLEDSSNLYVEEQTSRQRGGAIFNEYAFIWNFSLKIEEVIEIIFGLSLSRRVCKSEWMNQIKMHRNQPSTILQRRMIPISK